MMIYMTKHRSYANIVFSRRYHPPLRRNKENSKVQAEYDYDKHLITIFLPGLKKTGYCIDTKATHDELIRLFVHEVLHGVIGNIMKKDKLDLYAYDVHFPHNNGFEYSSLD